MDLEELAKQESLYHGPEFYQQVYTGFSQIISVLLLLEVNPTFCNFLFSKSG